MKMPGGILGEVRVRNAPGVLAQEDVGCPTLDAPPFSMIRVCACRRAPCPRQHAVQHPGSLLTVAAQRTAWEQLQRIPEQTWINLAICVAAVVIIARLWDALRRFNDYAPWLATAVAASMILFYWTYNRNEPRFLTPFIEPLTHILPTRSPQ